MRDMSRFEHPDFTRHVFNLVCVSRLTSIAHVHTPTFKLGPTLANGARSQIGPQVRTILLENRSPHDMQVAQTWRWRVARRML